MKWYTASEVASLYNVPVSTVRTHIERNKFGKEQRLNELGKFKIWQVSKKGADQQYGNQESTK